VRAWLPVWLTVALILLVTAPATYPGIDLFASRPAPAVAPIRVAPVDSQDVPWVYLRAAGATGNGVTDDTAAIQAALTAATEAGRPVFCKPGTYLVSSTLVVGTDFVGSASVGRAACTIKYVGPGAAMSVTANPVQIQNVVFDLTQDAYTGTGAIVVRNRCLRCVFASITVTGPPNATIPYVNYGIMLARGGTQDRFINISTDDATSAIIAGIGQNLFYQSTLDNVLSHHCGQMTGRACLQITGAVDTIMNSGIGGGEGEGAATRTAVLVAGTDAEAIDIIATELLPNAPGGIGVVITRPPQDASVVTFIDVRMPVPARLVSDIVTPPRVTRIATQEWGRGPVGFVSVAAPIAAFMPSPDSGITLDRCTCTAVAGTVAFTTGDAAPTGAAPFAAIRFQRVYPSAPIVVLSWNSESAAGARIYVDGTSAETASLRSPGLHPHTQYVFSYHVIER
jgi:hypothetical protein